MLTCKRHVQARWEQISVGFRVVYLTAAEFWFLIEHQAMKTSLWKQYTLTLAKINWLHKKTTVKTKWYAYKVYILSSPAVCGHTFVAAVLFIPVSTLHSWVCASGTDTQISRSGWWGGRRSHADLHLHLKNKHRNPDYCCDAYPTVSDLFILFYFVWNQTSSSLENTILQCLGNMYTNEWLTNMNCFCYWHLWTVWHPTI